MYSNLLKTGFQVLNDARNKTKQLTFEHYVDVTPH